METELQRTVDELMRDPNVTGVVCADKQGMCVAVAGKASSKAAGAIAAIANLAATLELDSENPVVAVESQNARCLIHQNAGVTVAVYKKRENA